jgi:hypothetical protein
MKSSQHLARDTLELSLGNLGGVRYRVELRHYAIAREGEIPDFLEKSGI